MLSLILSVTPFVCTHQISMQNLIHHPSAQAVSNHLRAIQYLLKKVQFLSWKTITHRRWWLIIRHTLQLQYLISFFWRSLFISISKFKKVLDLAITVSKSYQPLNRKLISKNLFDVIHGQNMERNLSLVKNSLTFCIVISRWRCHYFQNTTIENFGFRINLPVAVLELFDCKGHLSDGG